MTTQLNSNIQEAKKPLTPSHFLSDIQFGSRYDVSRQTIWRWAATDDTFPKPIKLSPGCTRWKLSDIEAWESAKGVAQ
jgi:predicted DNA-binding transcriptional regulator AlpA